MWCFWVEYCVGLFPVLKNRGIFARFIEWDVMRVRAVCIRGDFIGCVVGGYGREVRGVGNLVGGLCVGKGGG